MNHQYEESEIARTFGPRTARRFRFGRQGLVALLLAAVLVLLAACSTGPLPPAPSGYGYLTIVNPNNSNLGTFTYNNIWVDDPTAIVIYTLTSNTTAGITQVISTPLTAGTHRIGFTFTWSANVQPSTSSQWQQTGLNEAQGPFNVFVVDQVGYTFKGPLWQQ